MEDIVLYPGEAAGDSHATMRGTKFDAIRISGGIQAGNAVTNSTRSLYKRIKSEAINEEYDSINSNSDIEEDFHAVVESVKYEETKIQSEQIKTVRIDLPRLPAIQEIPRSEQNSPNEISLLSLCRLCAIPCSDMIHIFGSTIFHESITEKIQHCLPITVKRTDNLSKKVCQSCLQKLESCYQFCMTVMKAEEQLLVFYEQTLGKITEETSIIHCQTSQDKRQWFVNKNADNEETLTSGSNKDDNIIESNEFSGLGKDCKTRNSSCKNQNTKPLMETLKSGRTLTTINEKDFCYAALNSSSSKVHSEDDLISDQGVSDSVKHSPSNIRGQSKPRLETRLVPTENYSYSLRKRKPINYNNDNDGGLSSDEAIHGTDPVAQNVECQLMKCHICEAALQTIEKCHTHARIHASTKYYPCCFCNRILETEQGWKEHWLQHKVLDSEISTEQRMIGVHEKPKTSSGDVSGIQFRNNEEPNAHRKKNVFKCGLCRRLISSDVSVAEHRKLCSENRRKFGCDYCEKLFQTGYNLRRHMLIHTMERPFSCDICQESFTNKRHRDDHRRIHTGERPFSCDICSKTFRIRQSRHIHRRSHTGERAFSCDICPKSFTSRNAREYHRKIHNGERPFSCDICSKSFRIKRSRDSHRRLHTGERPFSCDICQKSFRTKGGRDAHRKIHTKEWPFRYNISSKSFTAKQSRDNHSRLHTDERPYQCSICEEGFHSARALRGHKKNVHS